ncbi:hypothetical protein SADUNF_Sadunf17G0033500 [Salix dunnii]|uniref:Uncharacterized protein n=1 Tax=Salix dunnii TaxID=1413687 RepID=A0A835J7S9_9ROSI|nr:hypothetical protein SADUNF_Sadunf17G0033500 [Salix dunnii]
MGSGALVLIANRRHGVKRGVVRRAKRERGKEGCNTRTSRGEAICTSLFDQYIFSSCLNRRHGVKKALLGVQKEKGDKGRVQHEDFEVTHPSTTLAQARLTSEFDGIRCISSGGFSEFRNEISRGGAEKALDLSGGGIKSGGGARICTSLFDHGCFSTVIANRRHGVKRGVVRRAKEKGDKRRQHEDFPEVTHPSTTLAKHV